MREGKNVLLVDLDGTLTSGSLPPCIHEFLAKRIPYLIEVFLLAAYPLYVRWPCKTAAVELLSRNRESGGRNIVLSSRMNIRPTRRMVQSRLGRCGVPFDELILRLKTETQKQFKLRVIEKKGCDILLENESAMVLAISAFQREKGMRQTSRFQTDGFFVVRFSA
jgi:hypothetical protein